MLSEQVKIMLMDFIPLFIIYIDEQEIYTKILAPPMKFLAR